MIQNTRHLQAVFKEGPSHTVNYIQPSLLVSII